MFKKKQYGINLKFIRDPWYKHNEELLIVLLKIDW